MALTAQSKIKKPKGVKPEPFEVVIAQHLFDIQTTGSSNDLKTSLKPLQITYAKEVNYGEGKQAVVIYVPVPQLKDYHRIHVPLVEELQKKLGGRHVLIVGQRRILPKEKRGKIQLRQKRPYSRSLTAVHDALLSDIAYPAEMVDRRIRVRLDGSRAQRVTLDPKEEGTLESKLETFSGVYKILTGKEVTFQFPQARELIK